MLLPTRTILVFALLLWAGASLSANMIAAPAKFQVADLTRPVALQVGRVQFLWVGYLEVVLAVLAALTLIGADLKVQLLAACAILVFALKRFVVMPRLSDMTDLVIAGQASGGSRLHLVFIALECAKLLALLVAAGTLLSPLLQTGRS